MANEIKNVLETKNYLLKMGKESTRKIYTEKANQPAYARVLPKLASMLNIEEIIRIAEKTGEPFDEIFAGYGELIATFAGRYTGKGNPVADSFYTNSEVDLMLNFAKKHEPEHTIAIGASNESVLQHGRPYKSGIRAEAEKIAEKEGRPVGEVEKQLRTESIEDLADWVEKSGCPLPREIVVKGLTLGNITRDLLDDRARAIASAEPSRTTFEIFQGLVAEQAQMLEGAYKEATQDGSSEFSEVSFCVALSDTKNNVYEEIENSTQTNAAAEINYSGKDPSIIQKHYLRETGQQISAAQQGLTMEEYIIKSLNASATPTEE